MFPMNRKVLQDPVVLEYDYRGKRTRKEFGSSFKARSAYRRLYNQGRNPAVVARPGKDSHASQ